jgi:hypothetical protein
MARTPSTPSTPARRVTYLDVASVSTSHPGSGAVPAGQPAPHEKPDMPVIETPRADGAGTGETGGNFQLKVGAPDPDPSATQDVADDVAEGYGPTQQP